MRRETYGSIAADDPAENNSSLFTSIYKDGRQDNGSETRNVPKLGSPLLDEIIIIEDEDDAFLAGNHVNLEQQRVEMKVWEIGALLSTAFAYGCVMTTLFLLTLPLECERIQMEHPAVSKSISLAIFVAIAGMTQLIAPLVGMLSDTYQPPILEGEEDQPVRMGIRLPYLVLGTILTVTGLLGQSLFSYEAIWLKLCALPPNGHCKWHHGPADGDGKSLWICLLSFSPSLPECCQHVSSLRTHCHWYLHPHLLCRQ
eukprot:scaffold421304_cov54-Attheya_sp.AAC.3